MMCKARLAGIVLFVAILGLCGRAAILSAKNKTSKI